MKLPNSFMHGSGGAVNRSRELVFANGCDPNVCFALDGSRSVSDEDFELQKDFVQLVAATISVDPEGTYSAVQYGLGLKRISSATASIGSFLDRVEDSPQMKARSTFLAPGIGYCIRALGQKRFKNEPKKIVLIGDGSTNYDSKSPPLDPTSIIRRWKKQSKTHSLSAVAVNFDDISMWKKLVGGRKHVFTVNQWFQLLNVLEKLVIDICDLENLEF